MARSWIPLDREFSVLSVNPKQLDRFRDRYFTSGKKDDKTDAYVLARTVLSDAVCFRKLVIAAPEYVMLREWSRQREGLVCERTRLLNRLKGALRRHYPSFLRLNALDDNWGRELFGVAKTPQEAARLRLSTIETAPPNRSPRRSTAALGRPVRAFKAWPSAASCARLAAAAKIPNADTTE